MTIPQLETSRLVMRAHRAADWDASAALWADPAVTRYIGGKPATRAETWDKLLRYGGLWALLGYGYWAVEDRASGAFAGEVGLADFKRELDPALTVCPEAGWVLAPAFHGRGYATEAVSAMLVWSDANVAAGQTFCLIAPGNSASLRVAAKAGYALPATTLFRGEPTLVLTRPVPIRGEPLVSRSVS